MRLENASWIAFTLGMSACAEPTPRPPAFDAGPRDGGGFRLDAATVVARGDAGAVLPPADREVELPWFGPTVVVPYDFRASPGKLDVHLNVDTTASMADEIAAVQSSLTGFVVPAVRQLVQESSFGVSAFQDFPAAPYGADSDRPFVLLQPVTSDLGRVLTSLGRLAGQLGNGGDFPESGFESIHQIATGSGYVAPTGAVLVPSAGDLPEPGGGIGGGVGFRDDAFRVLVHVTDATSHAPSDYLPAFPGSRGYADASTGLRDASVYFVGITNGGPARDELELLALETGAFVASNAGTCPTGLNGRARGTRSGVCPLVFDVADDGTGLADTMVDAITRLVSGVSFARVHAEVSDDRLGFAEAVVASSAIAPPGVSPPGIADDTPGDGFPDTFVDVRAGTELRFDLRLSNQLLPSLGYPQSFRIRVRIVADGTVLVDEWIRIVVPA